jgi:hypothetical protein
MSQELTFTAQAYQRLCVITGVLAGRWEASQRAAALDLSVRQIRCLLAAFPP